MNDISLYPNLPLISVLMTSYNREKYIAEAIESVLCSSYTNFELIIVDDCSTDNTESIVRKYEKIDSRVKVYVNDNNLGDYPNRNKAASYAKGKYLKYVDSDDIIYKYSLSIMVECMEEYAEVGYGFLNYPNQDNRGPFPLLFTPVQAYYEHYFAGGFFYAGPVGTIIRKSSFDAVGGFSGKRMIGDFELWLKLGAQFPVLKMQPSLVWWRKSEGQEYTIGHQSNMYIKLNYKVALDSLNQNICPLPEKVKSIACANLKKLQSRRILMLILKGKISDAKEIIQFSFITFKEIMLCILPIKKINYKKEFKV